MTDRFVSHFHFSTTFDAALTAARGMTDEEMRRIFIEEASRAMAAHLADKLTTVRDGRYGKIYELDVEVITPGPIPGAQSTELLLYTACYQRYRERS